MELYFEDRQAESVAKVDEGQVDREIVAPNAIVVSKIGGNERQVQQDEVACDGGGFYQLRAAGKWS